MAGYFRADWVGYLGTTFTPEVLLPFGIGCAHHCVFGGNCIKRNSNWYNSAPNFGWDLITSLLSSATAGVTNECHCVDMDADAVTVGLMQVLRFALVCCLCPP